MRFLRLAILSLLAVSLFLLAAVCAGAAVAAQFGRQSLTWDLLAHFAPIWFAGAAVAFLAGLAYRGLARTLILSMAAVGVIAAGALMAPELIRSTGAKARADAPDQLKIVQFNLWHSNEELDLVADWLVAEQADIVVFEEARPDVREAMASKPGWRLAVHKPDVMIFARMEPVRSGPARPADKAPGPLATATFRDQHGEFTVVGVHYAWPTDAADQQAQERRLAAVLAELPPGRTIVAGDFNSAPWSFSRRRWDATFGLTRRTRALFTWPARQYKRLRWLGVLPVLPIDHVYAGSDWATVKVERGPRLGSDHYPVIVTLTPVSRR